MHPRQESPRQTDRSANERFFLLFHFVWKLSLTKSIPYISSSFFACSAQGHSALTYIIIYHQKQKRSIGKNRIFFVRFPNIPMGYYFFSEAAPQSDVKKKYILYIRKIEKHCAKKSDDCCNRRKTVLYFNKIKPIIIPKGSNVMKKIIAAVFIVIFSAMLLGGCSAPKIETEKIVSADKGDYLNARSIRTGWPL